MKPVTKAERELSSWTLNFVLLGGGIAWVLHILLTYAIAEFGCGREEPGFMFLGVSGIAWMLLGASALPIALSLVSVWAAYRTKAILKQSLIEGVDVSGPEMHLVRIGLMLNLLFVLIIIVQTIPIFFFLQGC